MKELTIYMHPMHYNSFVVCTTFMLFLELLYISRDMSGSLTCVRRFTWSKKRGIETQNWIWEIAAIAIYFVTSLDSVLCLLWGGRFVEQGIENTYPFGSCLLSTNNI